MICILYTYNIGKCLSCTLRRDILYQMITKSYAIFKSDWPIKISG